MTSTTGTAGHPDVDEISALAEGLLSPSRTTDVQQHLDGCADCSDVYASLEEIRGLLGDFADPVPMPDDVADRINAALSTEALMATSGAPSAAAHVSRETSLTHASHGSRAPGNRSSERSRGMRSTTGPGRGTRKGVGHRRRTITLGAVFTVVLFGAATLLVQSLNQGHTGGPSSHARNPTASLQTFSSKDLGSQVTQLLKEHPESVATASEAPSVRPQPSFSIKMSPNNIPTKTATPPNQTDIGAAIPDCVRDDIDSSEEPIAAEQGIFKGKTVFLVVLPDASDQSKVSAYIVDASCTQRSLTPSEAILLSGSYPRH